MNRGRTVFSQLIELAPHRAFQRCVQKYRGRYRSRSFSFWDQFLAMVFAQLTYRESLRDIEACLGAIPDKLYHLGFRSSVSRSTLAEANEKRDWRTYAEFAQILIAEARRLYGAEESVLGLDQTIYALDSTTIDLCLSLFPWAHFRTTKGAVKLHTLLDLRGSIPAFAWITDGKVADMEILDLLLPEPGSIYILDRGYIDFERLYGLTEARAVFVTRAKSDLSYRRRYSHPVDKSTGLICDQTIVLTGPKSKKLYPEALRLVRFRDQESGKVYTFLTNDFTLPALTIAELYKSRWKVELFFRWIKQHLRIKAFYGTSENAVKTQIWIAISAYVLVAIAKKKLEIERDLYTLLQILSVTLFEKVPLRQALAEPAYTPESGGIHNQLQLFDL